MLATDVSPEKVNLRLQTAAEYKVAQHSDFTC